MRDQQCQHSEPAQENQAQLVSTREAAEIAGVTLRGLRYWLLRYPGLGVRVGGRWRVSLSHLHSVCAGVNPIVADKERYGVSHANIEEEEIRRQATRAACAAA